MTGNKTPRAPFPNVHPQYTLHQSTPNVHHTCTKLHHMYTRKTTKLSHLGVWKAWYTFSAALGVRFWKTSGSSVLHGHLKLENKTKHINIHFCQFLWCHCQKRKMAAKRVPRARIRVSTPELAIIFRGESFSGHPGARGGPKKNRKSPRRFSNRLNISQKKGLCLCALLPPNKRTLGVRLGCVGGYFGGALGARWDYAGLPP